MKQEKEIEFSPLITRLLPDVSSEEQRAAQDNLDHFISVLYRICDRIEREAEMSMRDNVDRGGKLDVTRKEV